MYCFPDICYKTKFCDITDELDILASFLGQGASLAEENLRKDLLQLIRLTYISIDTVRDLEDFPDSGISKMTTIKNKYKEYSIAVPDNYICENNINHLIYIMDMCRSFSEKTGTLFHNTFGDNFKKYLHMKMFINLMPQVLEAIINFLKSFHEQAEKNRRPYETSKLYSL